MASLTLYCISQRYELCRHYWMTVGAFYTFVNFVLVTTVSPAKMTQLFEMPTRMGQRMHILRGGRYERHLVYTVEWSVLRWCMLSLPLVTSCFTCYRNASYPLSKLIGLYRHVLRMRAHEISRAHSFPRKILPGSRSSLTKFLMLLLESKFCGLPPSGSGWLLHYPGSLCLSVKCLSVSCWFCVKMVNFG